MKQFTSYIVGLLIFSLVTVSLAGCNTIEGAGEDIEAGGEAIEEAAE